MKNLLTKKEICVFKGRKELEKIKGIRLYEEFVNEGRDVFFKFEKSWKNKRCLLLSRIYERGKR